MDSRVSTRRKTIRMPLPMNLGSNPPTSFSDPLMRAVIGNGLSSALPEMDAWSSPKYLISYR